MRTLLVLAALLVALPATAAEPSSSDPQLDKARAMFRRYVALDQSFDPALADLYADEAQIRTAKLLPTGKTQTFPIPAPQYKELVRYAAELARKQGDKRIYTEVRYDKEARGVRVNAVRISLLKKDRNWVSILFGPSRGGEWRILEESTLSRAK